jgi:small subunit ribosomal protein S20
MANHFSALKRARQTEKRTAHNRGQKSALRTAIRQLREAIAKGDAGSAREQFKQSTAVLDRAVSKGVLHRNTAARYKSRLSARLSAIKSK